MQNKKQCLAFSRILCTGGLFQPRNRTFSTKWIQHCVTHSCLAALNKHSVTVFCLDIFHLVSSRLTIILEILLLCGVQPSTFIVQRCAFGLNTASWLLRSKTDGIFCIGGWVLLSMHAYMASLWTQSLFQGVAKSQEERTVSKHSVTVFLRCYSPDFFIIQQHFFFLYSGCFVMSDFWVWYRGVRY